jgi:predicted membrane channel-forming protein YqfA (hemolysin III family)
MSTSDELRFLVGLLAVVIGFVGLFVASWVTHGLWHWIGLSVFVVGILAIFLLIRLTIRTPPDSPEGKAPPGQ